VRVVLSILLSPHCRQPTASGSVLRLMNRKTMNRVAVIVVNARTDGGAKLDRRASERPDFWKGWRRWARRRGRTTRSSRWNCCKEIAKDVCRGGRLPEG
jgi:hypothetical protein